MIGGYNMSLVIAVATDTFLLFGADTRGQISQITSETQNKLIKLNKNIIFGCTGGILDNFKFFDGFCYYSSKYGLLKSEISFDNLSYNEFIDIMTERFSSFYNEHLDKNNPITYDIGCIIGGHNGEKFELTVFSIGSKYNQDGIYKFHKPANFPYRGVAMGFAEHINKLNEGVYVICHQFANPNILQYKNVLKDVFDNGIKIDNTINNNVRFEKIKLKDVIF